MPSFSYIALDGTGKKVTGVVEAPARSGALQCLESRSLTPVSVDDESADARERRRGRAGLSRRAGEDFCRELSNLLASGVPMGRALSILCRQAHGSAEMALREIHQKVTGGGSLAEAMGEAGGAFSAVQVAMVRAGETGGFLDVVLAQIADFQARDRDLKSRIRGALAYPAVLAVVAAGVLVFLLTFFIPRFSSMFTDMGGSLPKLTRVIVSVSELILRHGPMALGVAVVATLVILRAMRSASARRTWEQVVLSAPVVGTITARLALVRFSRMLGSLIGAGVPLVTALRVARESLGKQVLVDTMQSAIEDVVKGERLSESLRACGKLFPLSVVEMVAVAEEAGRVDAELLRLADVYESELDRRLRLAVSLAEPLLLFIMAALIGAVVIGMLLPIFSLQDMIQ